MRISCEYIRARGKLWEMMCSPTRGTFESLLCILMECFAEATLMMSLFMSGWMAFTLSLTRLAGLILANCWHRADKGESGSDLLGVLQAVEPNPVMIDLFT